MHAIQAMDKTVYKVEKWMNGIKQYKTMARLWQLLILCNRNTASLDAILAQTKFNPCTTKERISGWDIVVLSHR